MLCESAALLAWRACKSAIVAGAVEVASPGIGDPSEGIAPLPYNLDSIAAF